MSESAPISSYLPATTLAGPVAPYLEPPAPIATRVVDAAELLAGARQVMIEHQGSLYRLSLTKNNRLILQK